MKIAIIHFGRKGAGPAISFEMALALSKLGHSIYYYASLDVENRQCVEKEIFNLRFYETYNSRLTYIKSVMLQINISKVIKQIKIDNPDVVYSTMNDMWLPFLFPRLKAFLRIKTIHDVGVHEGNNSLVNKWWNRSNFKDAEKFIILSKKFVPKLEQRGINSRDIAVIPHAGFDYYAKLGNCQKVVSDKRRLLFFGRIDKYKGLEILLQAMPSVIDRYSDVVLRIVGNGDISSYKKMISEISNHVEVHNRWIKDEEVAGFVQDSDVLVLPYTHATQSGVIPLAYAFSKTVIATNVGCLDEQVIDGKTGYLIPSNNSISLSEVIIDILSDKNKVEEMGKNAFNYMKENLTWDASAKKLIEFITR